MSHVPQQEIAPPVLMPSDRPRRPGEPPTCSAHVQVELGPLEGELGNNPQNVLLAGFAALLYRCTGQDHIGLRLTDATGRTEPVSLRITGESTLRTLADGTAYGRDAGTGTAPVGIRFAGPEEPSESARPTDSAEEPRPLELELTVRTGSAGTTGPVSLELRYDARLFDRTAVTRWLDHYRTLVEDGGRHPDRPVARLRLLTGPELRRTLVQWNRTETDLPNDGCLHEAFEARVQGAPDAVAIVDGGERWTYRRVNAEANRLARYLRSLGVGPDVPVGLCLDRSPGLLVAVLGILKAGGGYVPLDPGYPGPRIATMVEGTACAVMISRTDLTGNLPGAGSGTGAPLVLLDRDADVLAAFSEDDLVPSAGPENLCYVIHTSGSTGTPKPIALRHRGVLNNLADLNSRFRVGPGDAVLALSSPSFDMSVYEFLGITVAGGTVVIPDPARIHDPAHWAESITAHDVTVWNSAPALLGLLVDHLEQTGGASLPRLRLALLGGDWVPVTLPDRVRAIAPALRFIVMGGATEASIHSTIYEVEAVDPTWSSIPYGRPMANQRTYILDEHLQPVPPGVPGELYLAGVGLALGYLGQPERTAERFIEWSYGEVTGERLYRTGDLARFGTDGLIELLGRTDFQVKINGLRVELGEIEAVLRSGPGVRQTAVAARDGRLVGYVVPADPGRSGEPWAAELRALLAARLPQYMVPQAIVVLDALPLTPNGKLDRTGLPAPDVVGAAYRAPRSEVEKILAGVLADVLGRERVGVDDDFVALGGDSVRSIQVVTRARARGLELTARQVLQCPTVTALAEVATVVDVAAESDGEVTAPLLAVEERDLAAWRRRHPCLADVWPLTPMQSGMVFDSLLNDTGADTYHMQTVYHLSGPIDGERLRAAAQALLDRHAGLRVAFATDASDNQVQIVVDGLRLPWQEVDFGALSDDEHDKALRRFLDDDRATRFDLAEPPLLRMTLLRCGPDRAELVLSAHHALLDGWSEQVLAQDLLRLCAAHGDGSALPAVRPFRDFLGWLSRQDEKEAGRLWAEELAGVDGPTLLAPDAAPHAHTGGIGEVVLALSPEESRRLAAAELGVRANTLVQGAWAVLLSALTGREDVVFGATVSGRPGSLAGVESMAGLFINTVPVRVRCAPDETAAGLLTALQDRQTALLDQHHRSLTEIHRDLGLAALFDTLVVFQSYPAERAGREVTAAAGFEVTGIDSVGGVNYPLALFVEPDRLTVQYHQNRFDRRAGELIADRFRTILGELTAEPGRSIGAMAVLPADERARIAVTSADRANIPRPTGTPSDEGYQGGRTPQEVALCELLADALEIERVGIHDRFFDIGVNSLMAGRLVSRIRRTLGLTVSIRMVFQHPTVAQLSEHVQSGGAKPKPRLRRMTR